MAGIAPFRCPSCRSVVLISDRGKVRAVTPAELVGVDKGDPRVRCGECDVVSVWVRDTVKPL